MKGERRLAVMGASAALECIVGYPAPPPALSRCVAAVRSQSSYARRPVAGGAGEIATQRYCGLAYPKLASALALDLSRDIVHALAPKFGLDTVGQIAIDADWSALPLKRV